MLTSKTSNNSILYVEVQLGRAQDILLLHIQKIENAVDQFHAIEFHGLILLDDADGLGTACLVILV